MLKDKVYDVLKWVAITAIPSLTVFFETVLPVWDVPQVIISRCTTTVSAFGVFLAGCLMISNHNYKKNSEGKFDEEDME